MEVACLVLVGRHTAMNLVNILLAFLPFDSYQGKEDVDNLRDRSMSMVILLILVPIRDNLSVCQQENGQAECVWYVHSAVSLDYGTSL